MRLEMKTQPAVKDGRAKTSDPDRDGGSGGALSLGGMSVCGGGDALGTQP